MKRERGGGKQAESISIICASAAWWDDVNQTEGDVREQRMGRHHERVPTIAAHGCLCVSSGLLKVWS